MLSLVALIVVLVATAASACPQNRMSGTRGCGPRAVCLAAMSATATTWRTASTTTLGAKRSRRTGRGTRSSTARCCPSPPPTAATMPAGATRREDLTFAASSFPAWPPSTPRRVQLEPLLISCSARGRGLRLTCSLLPGAVTRLGIFQRPERFEGITHPHAYVGERGV